MYRNSMGNNSVILSKYVRKIFETPSNGVSEWFGYYNYDTLSHDQTKILCNRSTVDGVAPTKGQEIELGYYDISTREWHHIGYSDSWNWQQGSMLQWISGTGNENKVIYNLSKDGHLISRIHDIATGKDRDIDWPIYGITPDGKNSISLDLERSYWCRAYHYQSVANPEKEGRVYEEDGIFNIDLQRNTRERILSIQDIIKQDYRPYFENQKHWVEHIMISPSGTQFCFLHRFSSVTNVMEYSTRLMIANIDGTNLQCIEGWDKVRWSHFGWCKDDAFVIYTYYPPNIKETRSIKTLISPKTLSVSGLTKKAILKFGELFPSRIAKRMGSAISNYQYYRRNVEGLYEMVRDIDNRECRIDGHPSFTYDGDYMITDTYGDRKSWQSLYVYNIKTRKIKILGRFFANHNKRPSSCDLHPKLSKNNNFIVVDTAYDDKHHMILLEIDWGKLENER